MSQEPISPVVTTRPELTISAAALNDEPVELDGTPASPALSKNGRPSSKQDNPSPEDQKVINRLTHAAVA